MQTTTPAADRTKQAIGAFRLHRRYLREQAETEAACLPLGITRRDRHPLAVALSYAADQVFWSERSLREALQMTPRREVVDGEHFARLGELDRDGYPAVVVGRVDALAEIIKQWEPAL